MIRVINSIKEFEHLKKKWNHLYGLSEGMTPFQSFNFVYSSWLQIGEGNLYVLVVSDDSDDVIDAIFPFFIDKSGTLRFINDLHSDFCNALVRNELQWDYRLYEQAVKHIQSDKLIKSVLLKNLKASDAMLSIFDVLFPSSLTFANNAYSVLQIEQRKGDDHFTKALPVLNATERNRIKKVYNKLKSSEFKIFNGDMDYPEKELEALMLSMIEAGIREQDYLKQFAPLLKTLYQERQLLIGVTYMDSQPLAANIFLKGEDEYINWLVFYTDKQYNLWNVLQHVEMFSETGAVLNFARGLYEYKMRNFRPVVHDLFTFNYSKTIGGDIKILYLFIYYQLRQLAKRIITDRKK